ncbi:hypothetical protein JQ628_16440 [Bradyrhizobium lablabi]|uniref:hypothetical protein n=1 Tax=Bradyrhizobium lablabi TaxID=722472 RepID=UPI001BA8DC40|nr:hypothetical protein [Bradyrhizobium lablabi]MBR1123117.1 hypothetical protein [Bradyrhizobium lablabi]
MSHLDIPLTRKALSIAASAMAWLVRAAIGPDKAYHPEQHYMRGPGPKWREKHLLNSGADRSSLNQLGSPRTAFTPERAA